MPDWKAFNRWEEQYDRQTLPQLTVQESFRQYCELYEFAWVLAQAGPNVEYLTQLETNPHLRDLIEFKRILEKAQGK